MAPFDAEGSAGRRGQCGVRAGPNDDQHQVHCSGELPGGCAGFDLEGTGRVAGDPVDGRGRCHLHFVGFQFGVHEPAEVRINGGQDFRECLDLGDLDTQGRQAFGHFQADVSGSDHHRRLRVTCSDGFGDREGVTHGMQQVHPVARTQCVRPGQAGDRGPGGHRPGSDDQGVIGQLGGATARVLHDQPAGGDVDMGGQGIQAQGHAGGFQVGGGAVGEVLPVPDLPGQVVRDPADREVGERVGDDHGHVPTRVQRSSAQGCRYTRVTASDGDQMPARHGVQCSLFDEASAVASEGSVSAARSG